MDVKCILNANYVINMKAKPDIIVLEKGLFVGNGHVLNLLDMYRLHVFHSLWVTMTIRCQPNILHDIGHLTRNRNGGRYGASYSAKNRV